MNRSLRIIYIGWDARLAFICSCTIESWRCYLELGFDFLLRDELLVGRQGLCTRLLLILDLCNLRDEHCPVTLLLVELLAVLALVLQILKSKLQGQCSVVMLGAAS